MKAEKRNSCEKGKKKFNLNSKVKKHHQKGPNGINMNQIVEELAKTRMRVNQESPEERKRHIQAYFIGPKGSNSEFFSSLISKSINSHMTARIQNEASDPRHITRQMKHQSSFLDAQDKLQKELNYLLVKLRDLSSPFYSSRYYGHMNWEVTIPALVGNFAGMLYNQNNCAFEGAPFTTLLQIEAMQHYAQVFGYPPMLDETPQPHSWGHLTCGGTVANIESQWAARNCRFLTLALRKYVQLKQKGSDTPVNLPNGSQKNLGTLTAWELLNVDNDETMELYTRVYKKVSGFNPEDQPLIYSKYQDEVNPFTIAKAGVFKVYDWIRQIYTKEGGTYWPNGIMNSPILICSAAKHYSIPKGVSLLGFGDDQVHTIQVDKESRMNITSLRAKLQSCVDNKVPVLVVAGIVGTTEESVVDDLIAIKKAKDDFAKQGLYFHFHIDGAYGGYFCSMLRNRGENLWWDSVSDHVKNQLSSFHNADSITFDPHKTGYVPYACGGIIYRNHRLRDNLSFSAPYIYTGAEPNMAIYGIEGSKPGSAVTSVYLSLAVLPLTRAGHGELLERTMMNTKIFCSSLYQLQTIPVDYETTLNVIIDGKQQTIQKKLTDETFYCYQLSRTYTQKSGKGDAAIQTKAYKAIAETSPLEMEEVIKAGDGQGNSYEPYYKEVGPDLNIACFGINFKDNGLKNKSLKKYNEFNKKLIETSKPVGTDKSVRTKDLYVSETEISSASYGTELFNDFLKRHELQAEGETSIVFIRSTIMNAFFTELKGVDDTYSSNSIFLEQISEAACEALIALGYR